MAGNIENPESIDMTSPSHASGKQLWENRGLLVPGVRAVMGQRFTPEECELAAPQLTRNVFERLGTAFHNKHVLEIGTGIGRFTPGLAERTTSLIGIDLSKNMLDRAKTAVTGRENVRLLQGNATRLPLKDNTVNGIFEFAVLVHLVSEYEFQQAISEAKRVLKPDGTMVLCGQLSQDNKTHMINPQFIHRPIAVYEQALHPLSLVNKRALESLGEKFTMLFFQ